MRVCCTLLYLATFQRQADVLQAERGGCWCCLLCAAAMVAGVRLRCLKPGFHARDARALVHDIPNCNVDVTSIACRRTTRTAEPCRVDLQ
jgi:hypothetical protein